MSERETSIYEEVIGLAYTHNIKNTQINLFEKRTPLHFKYYYSKTNHQAMLLEYYKTLYIEHSYLQIKIENYKEILKEIEENLERSISEHAYIGEEIFSSHKEKTKTELNEEIEKSKKIKSEMDKLISAAPIQKLLMKKRQEDAEAMRKLFEENPGLKI